MSKIYTLDDATKSRYGKELYDFRSIMQKPLRWEDIQLNIIDSTFTMTPELENEVSEAWKKTLEKNPSAFDAPKLRLEGLEYDDETLFIHVSDKISYAKHNVIRNKVGLPLTAYPTPVTINALQETTDGYLLLGERNTGVSDQSGAAIVGAGFHDFTQKKGRTFYAGDMFETALRESFEETEYSGENKSVKNPINKKYIRAITLVRGSNTDVALGFHFPLRVASDQVDLNRHNKEFLKMLKIKNSASNLEHIIGTGNLRGATSDKGVIEGDILIADHPLGVLEGYRRMRKALKPSYVHY